MNQVEPSDRPYRPPSSEHSASGNGSSEKHPCGSDGGHHHQDGSNGTAATHLITERGEAARDGNTTEQGGIESETDPDAINVLRNMRRSHLRSDLLGRSQQELQDLPMPGEKKQYAVSTRWEHQNTARQEKIANRGKNSCYCAPCTCSVEDFYNYCCCGARRRVGGMFFLLERPDGSPIIVAGPCWPFCTFITVPLILLVAALVSYFIIFGYGGYAVMPWWVSLIYFPFVILTLVALFLVSCRDPGMVEKVPDEEAAANGWYWNEQTSSFRPPGAMYCRECKVLIQDYDHLCPWTGTGIGKGNMLAFKVFVASINVLCYLSIGLVAFSVIRSLNQ